MMSPADNHQSRDKPLSEVLRIARQWPERAKSRSRELIGALFAAPVLVQVAREVLDPKTIEDWSTQRIYRVILQTDPLTSTAVAQQLEAERTGDRPATGWGDEIRKLEDQSLFLNEAGMRSLLADVIRLNRNARLEQDLHHAVLTLNAYPDPDVPIEVERQLLTKSTVAQTDSKPVTRPVPLDLEAIEREGLPEIPWLIPGWIAEGDLAILAGGPYSGKSTLSYDLAQALSAGRPWCGIELARTLRVMVIDEEQGSRASARLMIRLGGHNPNLRVFSGAGFTVGTVDGLQMLVRELQDFVPDIVVFDSMTHLLAGVESENDAMLMGEVFRHLHRLREQYHTAFLVVDHRGKWGRQGTPAASELLDLILRGSTVKGTQASAVFAMIRMDDESANLIQAKRRENDRLLSIRIGYSAVEQGPITLTNLGTPEDFLGKGAKAQLWVVGYLQECGIAGRAEILAAGVAAGHEGRAIERALTELRRSKRLEKPKRGLYRLALGGNLAGPGVIEGGASDAPF